eukprot:TRINITY_DN2998_c0_g3_i2.p1 TRINITY_DN2998_c0_g3~~TRINITY_DN2998_c0_g3_i2.p1  ORF type:complete len:492 (+),score=83.34 TRINITY_DN2998_c0_g3_i2:199-1674(+)
MEDLKDSHLLEDSLDPDSDPLGFLYSSSHAFSNDLHNPSEFSSDNFLSSPGEMQEFDMFFTPCTDTPGEKFELPETKPRRRGRQRIDLPKDVLMARRAESNRKAAKESRERKKMHVERLEAEVAKLRVEVEHYRERLKKYESIEQQRNIFGYEVYITLAKIANEFYYKDRKGVDEKEFINTVERKIFSFVEERCKVLELLAQTMIEITVPMPLRFFIWAAKGNVNLLDSKKLLQAMQNVPSVNVKRLTETFNCFFASEKIYNEAKCVFLNTGQKIGKCMRQIKEAQEHLNEELRKIASYIPRFVSNFAPREKSSLKEVFVHLLITLKDQPEFENYRLLDIVRNGSSAKCDKECYYSAINQLLMMCFLSWLILRVRVNIHYKSTARKGFNHNEAKIGGAVVRAGLWAAGGGGEQGRVLDREKAGERQSDRRKQGERRTLRRKQGEDWTQVDLPPCRLLLQRDFLQWQEGTQEEDPHQRPRRNLPPSHRSQVR